MGYGPMKREIVSPAASAEHEELLKPLRQAIEGGSLEAFKVALAGGAEPGFVHWKVARAIPYGVMPGPVTIGSPVADAARFDDEFDRFLSVAQLCFHYDRLEMLSFAANAVWPEGPEDTIRTPADRMNTLCTRHAHDALARISLAHYAAFWKTPQSVNFIALSLELGQDDASLEMLSAVDPESAALIREARMQLSINRGTNTEAAAAPAARARNRYV